MRPLRQTRLRTISVALAVWFAGCVVLWYLRPAVPRVVVPRAEGGEVLGFTDDGRCAYGIMWGTFNPERDYSDRDVSGPIPDGPFRVWDVQTGRPLLTWIPQNLRYVHRWLPSYPAALVFSSAGLPLDGLPLVLFDIRSGTFEWIPLDFGCLADEPFALTPDGRHLSYLVDVDGSKFVHWYDRDAKKVVTKFPVGSPCTFHRDGRCASVEKLGGENGQNVVLVREAVTGRIISRYQTTEDVGIGEFSPDGRFLLVGGDGAYSVIDEGGHVARIPAAADIVHFYFVDAEHLITEHLTADGRGRLNRWDAATGNHLGRYEVPSDFELDFEFARQGTSVRRHTLITSTAEPALIRHLPNWAFSLPGINSLLQWDVRTYRVFDGLTGHWLGDYRLTRPARVHMSPDGRTLVNVSTDGTIEFWDIPARTSWSRVGLVALVWALPVVWFARRHARTLINKPVPST